MNTFIYQHKNKLIATFALILVGIVTGLTISMSYAQTETADISLDKVKQPKAVMSGGKSDTKVWLEFPIILNNHGDESAETNVTLNCINSTSTASYALQPGANKQTHKHPLTREELLAVNQLKKTKKSMACEINIIDADTDTSNNALTFDLYKNRIRVDIKNVRRK